MNKTIWDIIFKGGRGSGNFGHSGRPGSVGGSGVGGSGSVNESRSGSFVRRVVDAYGDDTLKITSRNSKISVEGNVAVLERYLKEKKMSMKSFASVLELSGLKSKISIHVYRKNDIVMDASYYKGSKHVGDGTLYIDKKALDISLLEFNSSTTNKGLGKEFIKNSEKFCKSFGLNEIALSADISIGRYAWAKLGFDYQYSRVSEKRDRLSNYVDNFVNENLLKLSDKRLSEVKSMIKKCKTANDIANVKIPEFKFTKKQLENISSSLPREISGNTKLDLGKAFMLDKDCDGHGSWEAVKKIK